MDGQRKQPRRSARTNKGAGGSNQNQQNIGGTANQRTKNDDDESSIEGRRAVMEAYERYRTDREHTDDECRSMIRSYRQSLPTEEMAVPGLGIAIPTPIVAGGVAADLLRVLERDYLRAHRAGRGGASSDVGASSWRARDHKKMMEGAMVGPDLGNGNDDDATSVAVSDDTISVGSGYTVRPDEGDKDKDKSGSNGLSLGSAGRFELGRSSHLSGLTKSEYMYFDGAPSAESTAMKLTSGGEKRTLLSLIQPSSQFVAPIGRFNAKRLKVEKPRTDWNGLDPNLLHDVFSRLNLREKVRCMGKVCRAWNELRSRSDLFADLSDESGPNAADMYSLLLSWLPISAAPKLTGIRLNVLNDEDDSRARYLIYRINPSIRKIVLSGPGWVAGGMQLLNIRKIGPSLTSLTLDNISKEDIEYLMFEWKKIGKTSETEDLLDLLKMCIGLEELKLPCGILWNKNLSWLLSQIGSPDKTPTALRVLDLTMQSNANDGMKVRTCTDTISPLTQMIIPRYMHDEFYSTNQIFTFYTSTKDLEHLREWAGLQEYCPNLEVLKVPSN